MSKRDEFSLRTKEILARRVGTLCSNPKCSAPTYGPSSDPNKAMSKGVAAHIRAAAPGGPRYDPTMTPEQRSSIENGIWLCESCAKMIDADPERYTVSVLLDWKKRAEERARKALENPRIVNFGPDFADTLLLITRQRNAPALDISDLRPGEWKRRQITLRPIQASRDLIDISIPLIFDPDLLRPDTCLLTLSCQNQGTGVDQFIKIKLSFEKPAIIKVIIPNPSQVQLIRGGRPGSSFATFMIRTLLPQELHHIRVLAKDSIPFTASLWTQNSGDSDEVFIYDVIFGKEERIEPDNSPPWAR